MSTSIFRALLIAASIGATISVSALPALSALPDVYTVGTFPAGGGFLACYPPATALGVNPANTIGDFDGLATTLTKPEGVTASAATGMFYATDFPRNAVDEWALPCPNGPTNIAPARRIHGALTQLSGPVGIAVDTSRNVIYVSNESGDRVTMYAPTANGNIAPFCTLQGAATRLSRPAHLAVEPALPGAQHPGFLYVTSLANRSVNVYPPVPCGNVNPVNRIVGPLTQMSFPFGIDVYATQFRGKKIPAAVFVADSNAGKIFVYTDGGPANRAPFEVIGGAGSMLVCPDDVRVSPVRLLIYAVDPCAMQIDAYAAGTVLNIPPSFWYVAPGGFVDSAMGVWLSNRN